MPSLELAPLTEPQRAELAAWMLEHADSLPQPVRVALQQHGALCEGLLGSRHKLSQVLLELRRALGITTSSERRCSGEPLGPVTQGDRARPKSKQRRAFRAAAGVAQGVDQEAWPQAQSHQE